MNTYLKHCNKTHIKAFMDKKIAFPFRKNMSITLGIAVKKLLQSNESLDEFKEKNPHLINLEQELKYGHELWANIVFLLKYQEIKGEHSAELLDLFS